MKTENLSISKDRLTCHNFVNRGESYVMVSKQHRICIILNKEEKEAIKINMSAEDVALDCQRLYKPQHAKSTSQFTVRLNFTRKTALGFSSRKHLSNLWHSRQVSGCPEARRLLWNECRTESQTTSLLLPWPTASSSPARPAAAHTLLKTHDENCTFSPYLLAWSHPYCFKFTIATEKCD